MRKLHGEQATRVHTPKEGHAVVIYTHKFRPEHYRKGVELITKHFPDAQLEHKQATTFFSDVPLEHMLVIEADARLKIVEKLRPMLDGPIDVQVYEIERIIGIAK